MIELTREELYSLVWSKPSTTIASELGITAHYLGRICRDFNIPKPPSGHWVKVSSGQMVAQPPLPKWDRPETRIRLRVSPEATSGQHRGRSRLESGDRIEVHDRLDEPHKLIRKTAEILRRLKPDHQGLLRPEGTRCLEVIVRHESIDRALRIMDALLKALEQHGMSIIAGESDGWSTTIKCCGIAFALRLSESTGSHPRHGKFILTVRCRDDAYLERRWSESDGKPLEERLQAVIDYIHTAVEQRRVRTIEHAERAARAEVEARLKAQQDEQERQQRERIARVDVDVANWQRAELLRQFASAAEESAIRRGEPVTGRSSAADMIAFARARADAIDPLTRPEAHAPIGERHGS